jgi:aminoglycoside 6'-N-acetyltransferase I
MLVEDISELARAGGAVSVWAGAGDESQSTSFSSANLYRSPTAAMVDFDVPDDHPINFWLGVGFTLVGVRPDEEGLGKPGIHFARRIAGDEA